MWGLLPFTQVSPLATTNIEDQKALIRRSLIAEFCCSWCIVFIWREFLNQGAFYPVVETPQTLDSTVRLPPISATFWDGIVMVTNNIVYSLGRDSCLYFSLPLKLFLSDLLDLGVCNTGSLAWSFELPRRGRR